MGIIRLIRREHAKRSVRTAPFFRKYPYRGPLSLLVADKQVLIDRDRGYLYNRIAKAANSTIVTNLASLKGVKDKETAIQEAAFTRPSQLSIDEMQRPADLFRFVFVRNPYSRTLSAYLDKVVTERRLGSPPPSFPEFCRHLAGGALHADKHWMPQIAALLLPIDEFDFIGRVETIGQDLGTVLTRIGAPELAASFVTRQSGRTGADAKRVSYYDNETRELVAKLFKVDFETFGYDPALY